MNSIFTYGTLMNPTVMKNVVKAEYKSVKALLRGYIRKKVKGQVYPGITECANSVIEGVLWLDVKEEGVQKLDYFESEGKMYLRKKVSVEVEGVST